MTFLCWTKVIKILKEGSFYLSHILASTNYILEAVRPDTSSTKVLTSAAAKLDSMIDMEEEDNNTEDTTNHSVTVNIEDTKQKIDKV